MGKSLVSYVVYRQFYCYSYRWCSAYRTFCSKFWGFFCLCDVAYICRRFLLVVRNEVTFVIKDGY